MKSERIGLFIFIFILYSQCSSGQTPTFSEDIAPLIYQHCTPCHRPSGAAPFSLITYQDVSKRAKFIRRVVETRFMPPWKADSHYQSFANDRQLAEKDINLITKWVQDGMPKGNLKIVPSLPKSIKSSQLGSPDYVLSLKKPYRIKGDNKEQFVMFKIPFELDKEKNVVAIELVPGNRKVLHHVNFAVFSVDDSIDIYNGDDFIVSDQLMSNLDRYKQLSSKLLYYGGWLPGTSPQLFPEGIGFQMPKRGVILMTTHFGASSIDQTDDTKLNLFFKAGPTTRTVQAFSIGSGGLGEITPSLVLQPDEVKTFTATMPVESDLSLLYVWPHMHLLGKSLKAYAITLVGDTIPLVSIPEWDFNWQEAYKFKKMLLIPKFSTIYVEGTYDNTSANLSNPFHPPRLIDSQGLMETTNEMLNLIIVFLPYKPKDEHIPLE